jgi:hypothetical protein
MRIRSDPHHFGGFENIKKFRISSRFEIWVRHPRKSRPDRHQNDCYPQHCYDHRSEGYLEGVSAETRVAATGSEFFQPGLASKNLIILIQKVVSKLTEM